jgi:hypothetical protein
MFTGLPLLSRAGTPFGSPKSSGRTFFGAAAIVGRGGTAGRENMGLHQLPWNNRCGRRKGHRLSGFDLTLGATGFLRRNLRTYFGRGHASTSAVGFTRATCGAEFLALAPADGLPPAGFPPGNRVRSGGSGPPAPPVPHCRLSQQKQSCPLQAHAKGELLQGGRR